MHFSGQPEIYASRPRVQLTDQDAAPPTEDEGHRQQP